MLKTQHVGITTSTKIRNRHPIIWAVPNAVLLELPLYIKNINSTFENVTLTDDKTYLNGVLASKESAEVYAYLSWLIRTKQLLA